MYKKLHILLIISILVVTKLLIYIQHMHNLHTIFAKFLEICKHFSNDLVNDSGNITRPGVVPKFSDLKYVIFADRGYIGKNIQVIII